MPINLPRIIYLNHWTLNRKSFISSIVPLLTSLEAVSSTNEEDKNALYKNRPPYLKPGDLIGICCPSGFIKVEDVQPAASKFLQWGFSVKMGNTIGAKDFTMGGTDDQRTSDLQIMLDDPAIRAIMFARGGYGAVRIIDRINFKRFIKSPKWLIGFSDATIFHTHLSNYKIPSLHSKMCNSFPADWSKAEASQIESIDSIRKCLVGEHMKYSTTGTSYNKAGTAEGVLIGGNLSMLQNVAGTASDIETDGKILFIEDVDEYLYNIDRMLWNLKRSGKLDNLKGLIVGGFNNLKPDVPGEEFGHTVYEMVIEKVKEYTYPVCFDFPVGHQKYNVALKCGVPHKLVVSEMNSILEEV